jgi:hypothetical protein
VNRYVENNNCIKKIFGSNVLAVLCDVQDNDLLNEMRELIKIDAAMLIVM